MTKPINPKFVHWLEQHGKFHLCLDELDDLIEEYEVEKARRKDLLIDMLVKNGALTTDQYEEIKETVED